MRHGDQESETLSQSGKCPFIIFSSSSMISGASHKGKKLEWAKSTFLMLWAAHTYEPRVCIWVVVCKCIMLRTYVLRYLETELITLLTYNYNGLYISANYGYYKYKSDLAWSCFIEIINFFLFIQGSNFLW